MGYLIVFLGAGIGGAIRHGFNQLAMRFLGADFPFGTLAINVIGSLCMGLLVGYFAIKGNSPQQWRLFLATGILGGFTTFSTFSLDAALLFERGQMLLALGYVLTSVVIGIAALFAGMFFMRSIA
jgi:CrcB protein